MYEYLWLIPVLPLVGFLLNLLLVRQERMAGWVGSGVVLAAFGVAIVATFQLASLPEEARRMQTTAWEWINAGGLRVPFGIMLDPLNAVMVLLVTGVGSLIHIYSIGYMHGDKRVASYFAYLNLFVTMMLFLVMANNMLLLFLGWEGVGLCSFLLIGYWFERDVANNAAVKAFVVNRIGDAAFLVAMMTIFYYFGTLNFYEVEVNGEVLPGFVDRASEIAGRTIGPSWQPFLVATVVSFLLLIGATGKSAQVPLFVWLPDAMAGPTPVSALIHAATMVTAGIYLMARLDGLFVLSATTQGWVMVLGGLTAFIGAMAAVAQYDIKRVLAFSTISQLGFMVAACGMGIYVAAIFHLLVHGIFKALLFLAAGSVIHGTHDTQDMRRMGGLRNAMPITFWTYVIGAAALAGIFPLAGFWSKDEIIAHAVGANVFVFFLLVTTSLLTAFYMARQVTMIFFGNQRDPSYQAHESPRIMTVPLIILALGAVFGGALNLPQLHWLLDWLRPVLVEPPAQFNVVLALVVLALSIGMAYLGYLFYRNTEVQIQVGQHDPLHYYTGDIYELAEEAWYFDRVYNRVVVGGYRHTARFFATIFDPQGIDGLVRGVGGLMTIAGQGVRRLQSGYVRSYALFFLIGVIIVLGYLLMFI
jgi:NADH-quinone oxidoreductase subunit L